MVRNKKCQAASNLQDELESFRVKRLHNFWQWVREALATMYSFSTGYDETTFQAAQSWTSPTRYAIAFTVQTTQSRNLDGMA